MFIPLPFYSPMDSLPGVELNDLMDYLFGDNRNAETLTFLLNEKYNLSLSATNFNGQENDKLK